MCFFISSKTISDEKIIVALKHVYLSADCHGHTLGTTGSETQKKGLPAGCQHANRFRHPDIEVA
jgi:hypothetical protein